MAVHHVSRRHRRILYRVLSCMAQSDVEDAMGVGGDDDVGGWRQWGGVKAMDQAELSGEEGMWQVRVWGVMEGSSMKKRVSRPSMSTQQRRGDAPYVAEAEGVDVGQRVGQLQHTRRMQGGGCRGW